MARGEPGDAAGCRCGARSGPGLKTRPYKPHALRRGRLLVLGLDGVEPDLRHFLVAGLGGVEAVLADVREREQRVDVDDLRAFVRRHRLHRTVESREDVGCASLGAAGTLGWEGGDHYRDPAETGVLHHVFE